MTAKSTAPGPDGIPGKVLAVALSVLGNNLMDVYNKCLSEGIFPNCWKNSRLVLLPKPRKDLNTPTAYRPICLLNEAGKLLERIIIGRINEHLNCVGPNLNEQQYGFRPGRSTIEAINMVKNIVQGTVSKKGIALAVSVDIVNAFNTIPQWAIEEGLRKLNLPNYITRVIRSYLAGRVIEYKGKENIEHRVVDRGVRQGSVLGSLLWNVGYDASLPTGVYLICYADDTLLIACGKQWSRTTRLMEAGIEAVVRKIKGLGLEIATHKTEATWFHGLPRNKNPPESWIAVGEDRIRVGRHIKYLGLILDGRLDYKAHFAQLAPRVEKAAINLGRLLPNTRGPSLKVRRLYCCMGRQYGRARKQWPEKI